MREGPQGFTLLELLVALSVFAVVSVAAYQGVSILSRAHERQETIAARLTGLQRTVASLRRDVAQIAAVERPLTWHGGRQGGLVIVRGGWPNPAGLKRSGLLRVRYSLEAGRLRRRAYLYPQDGNTSVLDETMMDGLDGWSLRLLVGNEWVARDTWPPEKGVTEAGAPPVSPRALEIVFDTRAWGPVTVLLAVTTGQGGAS